MTESELEVRLDLIKDHMLSRQPKLSLKEKLEMMGAITRAANLYNHCIFSSPEEEVAFYIAKAEVALGWSQVQ